MREVGGGGRRSAEEERRRRRGGEEGGGSRKGGWLCARKYVDANKKCLIQTLFFSTLLLACDNPMLVVACPAANSSVPSLYPIQRRRCV